MLKILLEFKTSPELVRTFTNGLVMPLLSIVAGILSRTIVKIMLFSYSQVLEVNSTARTIKSQTAEFVPIKLYAVQFVSLRPNFLDPGDPGRQNQSGRANFGVLLLFTRFLEIHFSGSSRESRCGMCIAIRYFRQGFMLSGRPRLIESYLPNSNQNVYQEVPYGRHERGDIPTRCINNQ